MLIFRSAAGRRRPSTSANTMKAPALPVLGCPNCSYVFVMVVGKDYVERTAGNALRSASQAGWPPGTAALQCLPAPPKKRTTMSSPPTRLPTPQRASRASLDLAIAAPGCLTDGSEQAALMSV
jgi:hypothetical protein